MNNNNGRVIKYVKLHGGDAFIPGVGGLGTTLPPVNKTLQNFVMTHGEDGVYLSMNGVSAIIPWANIQLAVYGAPKAE